MTIDFGSINYWAVIVAAFATFMLGGLWYTALFGKARVALLGWNEQQLAEAQKRMPPAMFFTVMIVAYLVTALILAILASATGVNTLAGGLLLGALLWAGFALTIGATGHVSFDHKHGVFGIDAAFQLVFLLLMGAIIGAWQ